MFLHAISTSVWSTRRKQSDLVSVLFSSVVFTTLSGIIQNCINLSLAISQNPLQQIALGKVYCAIMINDFSTQYPVPPKRGWIRFQGSSHHFILMPSQGVLACHLPLATFYSQL